MRVNVYNEELTDRVELTQKDANTVTFNGIRFFIGEPFEHTEGDDDSPAVTFWFSDAHGREQLRKSLRTALTLLDAPIVKL